MQIFDGKTQALLLDQEISRYISENPLNTTLAVIMVGENSASQKFVDLKLALCKKLGIPAKHYQIPAKRSDGEIFTQISEIFANPQVSGGIIQLPLPRESLNQALNLIPEEKDIDRISPKSQKEFYDGDFSKLSPTVRAFEHFIKYSNLETDNLETIVVGKGFLVGAPLGYYLASHGSTVQYLLDYKTGKPLNCHLLILSAGSPELVKGESIAEGCNVVDFGSSVVHNKTIGDLDLKSRLDHLGVVSLSPGGMGPLVIRYLLMNSLGI